MNNYVITIARGYGSGGRTIGKLLAKELNISYYDREILKMASEESGINEALFGKADETVKTSTLLSLNKGVYKGEVIPPNSTDFVSDDNLFNYQAKIIKQLAEKESCIIIGRCADYILKDMDNVIRIYVHAPLENCVETLKNMYGDSEKAIAKKIQKIDRQRKLYYEHYTGRDWDKASNYDLCLNTKDLNFAKCVEIVKNYKEVRFRK